MSQIGNQSSNSHFRSNIPQAGIRAKSVCNVVTSLLGIPPEVSLQPGSQNRAQTSFLKCFEFSFRYSFNSGVSVGLHEYDDQIPFSIPSTSLLIIALPPSAW